MRFDPGTPPWEPASGACLEHVWHIWDYPRWGYFALEGARVAFHRHENVGEYNHGPSLWTYRPLSEADLAALTLPFEQWGEVWGQAYAAWQARTPACGWAVADHDLHLVRWGALTPPVADDEAWAEAFGRAQGIATPAEEP